VSGSVDWLNPTIGAVTGRWRTLTSPLAPARGLVYRKGPSRP